MFVFVRRACVCLVSSEDTFLETTQRVRELSIEQPSQTAESTAGIVAV